ncbi:integrase core domain-containing protein [Gilliamella sp. App6-5]|jgi:lipopolysaccharide biosynthesis glycosyltransferase|uniref:integrase core domain-containing protein n=1 Tax=Gilliamella sp. App6-5 TaxID=3120232 RepID=UPI0009BFC8B5|nr:integrase core domain-containing protein [Gilliamella apicola]
MVAPKINIFIQIDNNYALQYLEGVFIPITDVNIKAQANTYLLKRVITIVSIKNLPNLPANEWESGKNDTHFNMEMWHNQQIFEDSKDRQQKLKQFIIHYNTVKPHKVLSGKRL